MTHRSFLAATVAEILEKDKENQKDQTTSEEKLRKTGCKLCSEHVLVSYKHMHVHCNVDTTVKNIWWMNVFNNKKGDTDVDIAIRWRAAKHNENIFVPRIWYRRNRSNDGDDYSIEYNRENDNEYNLFKNGKKMCTLTLDAVSMYSRFHRTQHT